MVCIAAFMRGWKNIARALLLVVLFSAWNAISDWLYALLDADRIGSPYKLPLILLGTLVTCGGIIGLGCVLWGKASLRELGWRFDGFARLAAMGLLLTGIEAALIFGAYAWMDGREGVSSLAAAIASISAGDRLFFFVMGAKVAFVEETLFRGDLLRALQERLRPALAVVCSSVVFALYHLDLTPLPLALKAAFGIICAVAMLRTRSLLPAAIAHAMTWTIFAYN